MSVYQSDITAVRSSLRRLHHRVALQVHPPYLRRRLFRRHARLDWQSWRALELEPELLLSVCLLQPTSTFIDVGANLGAYIFMAERRISSNQIYAFEPNAALARALRRMFPGANVIESAVTDFSGSAQFKVPYIDSQEFHTRGTLRTEFAEENETAQNIQQVGTISLDDFVIENRIEEIDLLKIDVEGSEYDALRGAQQTIRDHQPAMIIEIEQRHHQGMDIAEIFEFIGGLEYRAFYFDRADEQIKELASASNVQRVVGSESSPNYINNFLFVPLAFETDILQRVIDA